jgi:hypothetical protein
MAVQLRIGRLPAGHASGGGVLVLGDDQILRGLLNHLAAIPATHHRHLLAHIPHGLLDRARVRSFDFLSLPRFRQSPHRRDGLRRAERHIDPAAPTTPCALGPQEPAGARTPALHERDEIPAGHRTDRVDPEPTKCLGIGEPAARRLRQLAVRGQVVVPALRCDRLGLQIPGVAAALGGTDARRAHHNG